MQVLTVPSQTRPHGAPALGRTLRTLRLRRGMTQTEVSNISGVERGYYGHLERGSRRNPSQDTLEKLAHAFDISVAELLRMIGSIDEDSGRPTVMIEVEPAKAGRLKNLERFSAEALEIVEQLLARAALG